VAVGLFQPGFVHVLMSVLSPVVVGVGVFVGHVVVRMGGVCVAVRFWTVLVLVRVWCVVGVLLGHGYQLSLRYIHSAFRALSPASRW
jgi:hypothetical protein